MADARMASAVTRLSGLARLTNLGRPHYGGLYQWKLTLTLTLTLTLRLAPRIFCYQRFQDSVLWMLSSGPARSRRRSYASYGRLTGWPASLTCGSRGEQRTPHDQNPSERDLRMALFPAGELTMLRVSSHVAGM
jgi:hypothetical protein